VNETVAKSNAETHEINIKMDNFFINTSQFICCRILQRFSEVNQVILIFYD
jgi:hypothetical protein